MLILFRAMDAPLLLALEVGRRYDHYMKNRSLFKSTGLVACNTMLSRILGLIRDMAIAQIFGATAAADAFLVAFKLPNFMRRLFAEGAFSQAFIPVLSEFQTQNTHQDIKAFIDRIAGTLGSVLLVVCVLAVICAPLLVSMFAPGFAHDGERYHLAIHMLRITFPYLLFVSLTAFCGAILNTYGRYGIPAFTPIILNVCLIVAAYLGARYFTTPIYALAWAIFTAGVLQLLFQLPFLGRLHLVPFPRLGFVDPAVKRVLKLMVPALFGVSVAQVSLLVDTIFASFLKVGSIAWLYYSDRLMNFPLGVFAVAIATVILPHLSRSHATNNQQQYSKTLDWSLRLLLLIGLPSSVGLIVMAGPLLATLLQYKTFSDYDVMMARQSLMAFALGVQAFMLIKVFASGFYAQQNIKTPVKIAAFAVVCNIFLNLALIFPLQHAGLALATSLSGFINSGLLLFFLLRKKIFNAQAGWLRYMIQLVIANAVMAVFLYFAAGQLQQWLQGDWLWRICHLTIIIVAAVVIYFLILLIVGLRPRHFKLAS